MLTVSTMFMTFMVGSAKIKMDQQIKNEGSYALNQMEHMIRNAKRLAGNCNNSVPMDTLIIENLDDEQVEFFTNNPGNNGRIAYTVTDSSGSSTYFLTSEGHQLSSLLFDCYQPTPNIEDVYYIKITFTLKSGPGSTTDKETAIQTFTTGVTLRNKIFAH